MPKANYSCNISYCLVIGVEKEDSEIEPAGLWDNEVCQNVSALASIKDWYFIVGMVIKECLLLLVIDFIVLKTGLHVNNILIGGEYKRYKGDMI